MFIGVEQKKQWDFKEKRFFFFFIPIYKKFHSSSLKTKIILGITFYKVHLSNNVTQPIDNTSISHLINLLSAVDRQKDINLLLKSVSANLRDLKRFENKLIKKFPELK